MWHTKDSNAERRTIDRRPCRVCVLIKALLFGGFYFVKRGHMGSLARISPVLCERSNVSFFTFAKSNNTAMVTGHT